MCVLTCSMPRLRARQKAIVDLLGCVLLLLPVMAVIIYFALPYVARSWSIFERSREVERVALRVPSKDAYSALRVAHGIARNLAGAAGVAGADKAPDKRRRPQKRSADAGGEFIAVLMVLAVCVLLFAGYPVALTLGGRVASPSRSSEHLVRY